MNDDDASHNCGRSAGLDPRIERTRAAVLGSAADLLRTEGPDAVTHARVAVAADVSRTTVYKHYPERADLLRATIEEIGKTLPDPEAFNGEVRHDLAVLLGTLAADLGDEAHTALMLTMLARARYDDVVAGVRDEMMGEIEASFADIVGRAVERGELRGGVDPGRALASLAGALMFMRFLGDRNIDDEVVSMLVDDFVDANTPG